MYKARRRGPFFSICTQEHSPLKSGDLSFVSNGTANSNRKKWAGGTKYFKEFVVETNTNYNTLHQCLAQRVTTSQVHSTPKEPLDDEGQGQWSGDLIFSGKREEPFEVQRPKDSKHRNTHPLQLSMLGPIQWKMLHNKLNTLHIASC